MKLIKGLRFAAPLRRTSLQAVLFGGMLLFGAHSSQAGNGSIDTANKTIDLSVLFSYQETDDNLDSAAVDPDWRQVFNDASSRLWNATNGQLKIGKVTVYRRAFNKKDSADVWILKGAGGAYANGIAKLGVAGNRMTFYQNTHRSMNAAYQGGFSIVHEMGHYVFGCYDQYLGASVPFAKKDNFTAADLSGDTKNAFIFSVDPATDPVASIMDGGGGVNNTRTEFDTAANVVKGMRDRNKWWMNKQWFVNKESCWETMGKFKWGGVNVFPTVPAGASETALPVGDTAVTWEVIPTLSRLAICIDRSGSMSIENRMDLAKLGARILTSLTEEKHEFTLFPGTVDEEKVVFEGDFLGVVDFDDVTTTTFPMTEVDKAGTAKANAKAAINGLTARGSTAIGDGAQRSLDIITALGDKVTQEAIILLSDGQTNTGSSPAVAANNAKARGAKIYTIALGAGADSATLASMAATTGGKFYAATNGLGLIDIYSRIYGELRGGGLVEAINDLSLEATATDKEVTVDPLTQEVTFSVASPDSGFSLAITSPQNVTYTGSAEAEGVIFENSGNELHYRVSKPAPGKWKIKITSPDTTTVPPKTYQYSFITNSSNANVSVTAYPGAISYAYPEPALLFCQVTAGDPVTGASVTADVSGPDGVLGAVTLFDDGLPVHGDEEAGDGLYSAYYSAFPASGTYSFTVRVENTKGVPGIANPEDVTTPFPKKPIPPFSRETTTNVAVTGVPVVDRQWVRVNALQFTENKSAPDTATLKTSLTLNSPTGLFTPLLSDLIIRLNGFQATATIPASIFKEKKPGTYSFQSKAEGITGSLRTFVGGSSRSEVVIVDKKVPSGSFTYGTTTTERVQFGTFDETVSLKTIVNRTQDGISYNSKKNFLNTSVLYVDGLTGAVVHQQNKKDSFRIVATLEGNLGYNPELNSLVINIGGFQFTVPPNALTLNAKKQKGKGTFAVDGGTVTVAIDLTTGVLSVKGSKLNIGQDLSASTVIGITAGSFNQANLLVLTEKLKKGGSTFKF